MSQLTKQEIVEFASHCWYQDEDLQIFDYQKFAKLIQENQKNEDNEQI